MNFKPLKNRVVLEPYTIEEKTLSGIILAPSPKEKQERAKVVAIGKEVTFVKVGDNVLYESFRVSPIEIEGNSYVITDEEFIVGVFEQNNNLELNIKGIDIVILGKGEGLREGTSCKRLGKLLSTPVDALNKVDNILPCVDVNETGKIISYADGIAQVYGLKNVMAGELVEFENGERGLASKGSDE